MLDTTRNTRILSAVLAFAAWACPPGTAAEPDPRVAELVGEIRANALIDRVEKLVSFGTRYSSPAFPICAQIRRCSVPLLVNSPFPSKHFFASGKERNI